MQTKQTPEVIKARGFYHVRLGFHWTIAQCWYEASGDRAWGIFGTNVPLEDGDFDEIGDEVLPQGYDKAIDQQIARIGGVIDQNRARLIRLLEVVVPCLLIIIVMLILKFAN